MARWQNAKPEVLDDSETGDMWAKNSINGQKIVSK